MEVEGLNLSDEQLRQAEQYIPWQAGTNKFESQKGSGGFNKVCKYRTKLIGGVGGVGMGR